MQGLDGDEVTYCFEIENTGDTDVVLTFADPDLGGDGLVLSELTLVSGTLGAGDILASGDTVVYAYETTITADLDAGDRRSLPQI